MYKKRPSCVRRKRKRAGLKRTFFRNIRRQYISLCYCIKVELLGDGEAVKAVDAYQPLDYLTAVLKEYSDKVKMKNLVSDLIVYATAAQKYTGYNTNDLIADRFAGNENFTPTSGDVPACSDFSLSASADAGVYFASASVNFSNVNRLYFTYVTDDAANTVVKVDGKAITEVIDLGGGKYGVYSADLYATEFDRILTVTVEKSGNLVQTLTYSINHYAAQKQSSANTAMAELAKATYRYGASAEKYAKGGSV